MRQVRKGLRAAGSLPKASSLAGTASPPVKRRQGSAQQRGVQQFYLLRSTVLTGPGTEKEGVAISLVDV